MLLDHTAWQLAHVPHFHTGGPTRGCIIAQHKSLYDSLRGLLRISMAVLPLWGLNSGQDV